MTEKLTQHEQDTLVYAARYAHNINTSASFAVSCTIRDKWDRLSEHTQRQLSREAKEQYDCGLLRNMEDWRGVIEGFK